MDDFSINLVVICIILISFLYTNKKFKKTKKHKKKSLFKTWFITMIILTFIFYLFVLASSLVEYSYNIFWNIVFITLISLAIYFILYIQYKKRFLQKTTKDIISLPVKILLIILLFMLLFNFTSINNKIQFISKGKIISFNDLEKGDILVRFKGGTKGGADSLLPGYWSHMGLIIEKANNTYKIIESRTRTGVKIVSFEEFESQSEEMSLLRVKGINSSIKEKVVEWSKQKVGLPYNFNLINKRIEGNSYYCSEFIWAAYKRLGIDLDKNEGFSLKYFNSVSPQEIFGDDDVEVYRINKSST